jgi:hypothetical protein
MEQVNSLLAVWGDISAYLLVMLGSLFLIVYLIESKFPGVGWIRSVVMFFLAIASASYVAAEKTRIFEFFDHWLAPTPLRFVTRAFVVSPLVTSLVMLVLTVLGSICVVVLIGMLSDDVRRTVRRLEDRALARFDAVFRLLLEYLGNNNRPHRADGAGR